MAKMSLSPRILLILIMVLQIFFVSGFELAHDEAYYWLFSRNLDWGYFDHPPMVAVIIRLFSFFPKSELAVRFGFLVLQYLTVEVIWKLVPRESHRTAMILFFAFPLASFSGLFALPDMPLLFMTALYCYGLKEFLEKKTGSVLKLSLVVPLLLYSKYHGILLLFFTILALPQILLRKEFWWVTGLSLIIFLPHVWWQYQHDFPTLKYHFLERPKAQFSINRLGEYLGVQIGLAGLLIGPLVWYSVLKYKSISEFQKSLKWICIGVTLFFFISSFSKKFEANWTVFLSIPLIIIYVLNPPRQRRLAGVLLIVSFCIIMLSRLMLVLPIDGPKRLAEFRNWKKWSREIKEKCEDGILLANNYQLASKLSFYTDENVHALNYKSRKNQFDLWPLNGKSGQKTCYLTDKNEFEGESIQTPEGKKLKFVTHQSLEQLKELKRISRLNQ